MQFRPLIDRIAAYALLPPWVFRVREPESVQVFAPGTWLEGLIMTESAGFPDAVRYERHQDMLGRKDSATDQDTPGQDDGWIEDDKSYGLMQIMGYNLKALTHAPASARVDFRPFLDPEVNMLLGTRLLVQELHAVNGDVPRALARYNGGPTGDDRLEPGAPMRVQVYVDKVLANALGARRERIKSGWPA